jgi:hypothetical protein
MTQDKVRLDNRDANLREACFVAEYIKHLNTLSTGSILLMTIFLDKLFAQPRWKVLVALTLISFLASVIGGVGAYSLTVIDPTGDSPGKTELRLALLCTILLWAGFVAGILCLAIFAIRNLF